MLRLFRHCYRTLKRWQHPRFGGGCSEHVCCSFSTSEEANGEIIVTSAEYYYRANSRKEAYQAVRAFLVHELRMYREMYVDDVPDYKGRD